MNYQDPLQYHETLIAIASVSAVLWTGGLIIRQIRQSDPKEQTDAINAGMAATAFGALAPLFALLAAGTALRLIALAAGLLYLAKTYGNIPNLIRARKLLTALGFFFPTVAMLAVAAVPPGLLPSALLIAWEALTLDFLGYFILSEVSRG